MRRSLLVLVAAGLVAGGVWVSAAWAAPAGGGTVYVATGENFPDAVVAGAAGGAADGPVLLVSRSSIPAATLGELNRLQPFLVVIVGGTGVISQGVEDQLKALSFGPVVVRKGGADRYQTAALLSRDTFPRHGAASCPGSGFFPEAGNFDYSTTPTGRFHPDPGFISFYCELSIEDGAMITQFTGSLDDSGTSNAPCGLHRVTIAGSFGIGIGTHELIAQTPSTSGTGLQAVTTTSISSPLVDNSRYGYYARCSGSPEMAIVGVVVEYELTR
jgi:hypothetical protein